MSWNQENLYRLNESMAVEAGDASKGLRILTIPSGAILKLLGKREVKPHCLVAAEWDGLLINVYAVDLRDHATALDAEGHEVRH